MRLWNILVTGDDGRKFYQNFHVIERSAEAAAKFLQENFPDAKIRPTLHVEQIEELEDAELYLPGIVYRSGKAYFNRK